MWAGLLRAHHCDLSRGRHRAELARRVVFAWVVVGFAVFGVPAIAGGNSNNVLVLYSSDRLLPSTIDSDSGLREALAEFELQRCGQR